MKGPTAPKDPENGDRFFILYGTKKYSGQNAGWQGNPVYL